MSTVAEAPPVRHGTCRLTLTIDGFEYRLTRGPAPKRGAKVWRLKSLNGPRAGMLYSVVKCGEVVSCTCPDQLRNNAVCKHVRALTACGLVTRHHCKPLAYVIASNLALGAPAAPAVVAGPGRAVFALPGPVAEGGV